MKLSAASPALILVGGVFVLSAMDATIKFLSQTNHTLVVTLGRYVVGAAFALVIWTHAGRPAITGAMWRAHWVRGLVIAVSATSFFWSLTVLPLAEAVALSFFYPLIVPFVAAALIGEKVRGTSVAAAGLGFLGVIVTMQGAPAAAQSPLHYWGVAAVILAATTFAVSIALMRARARSDGAPIVGVMATVIPGLIVAGPAIAFAPAPRLEDWPYFLLMGVLAAAGMYLMARAYAAAEAQQLAPIHYSELLWASLIGYFVFQEIPRPQVLIGALVIIAACLWAAWDERRLAPRGLETGS
ncbi:MAG: DMT family transporter [Hydrogenophilaceae bacterium]|jgi:S-adenosylmethionine uptake transporter|nr:DMT family transporter [Hydrogenophilaceae bacterium]